RNASRSATANSRLPCEPEVDRRRIPIRPSRTVAVPRRSLPESSHSVVMALVAGLGLGGGRREAREPVAGAADHLRGAAGDEGGAGAAGGQVPGPAGPFRALGVVLRAAARALTGVGVSELGRVRAVAVEVEAAASGARGGEE